VNGDETMKSKKTINIAKLVISIVVCQCAGIVGSVFTTPAIPTWYAALEKPVFTPPNWLFAPAWITLYLLMGIAASLIWRAGLENRRVRTALIIFLVQLVLNSLWSVIFFGMQSPFYGVIVIIILWLAILLTILKFARIAAAAAWLMVPYILWVSFASALNIAVWLLNP
jgi:tryptophan-rich sensory protein